MKKVFYFMSALLVSLAFTGCSSCQSGDEKQDSNDSTLIVENTISVDKEYVFTKIGSDQYRYFETAVILKDYLDSDSCDGTIISIRNIFEYLDKDSSLVVIESLYKDGDHTYTEEPGPWVGDIVLNDAPVKLTFKEAFDKVMATDCVKPHTVHYVLRRELGPKPDVNPQYIFGDQKSEVILYVDAVTGDVSLDNPAYDKE